MDKAELLSQGFSAALDVKNLSSPGQRLGYSECFVAATHPRPVNSRCNDKHCGDCSPAGHSEFFDIACHVQLVSKYTE